MSWLDERARNGGVDEIPLAGVPGRLWLCGKHFIGPDPAGALARTGADVVVCLNEAHELSDRYPDYVRWLAAAPPERVIWFPVPDLHAPEVDEAREVLGDLRSLVAAGRGLLMHCGAGHGRAGTMAAGLLITLGMPRHEAIELVEEHRVLAGPQAAVQADLLVALAAR